MPSFQVRKPPKRTCDRGEECGRERYPPDCPLGPIWGHTLTECDAAGVRHPGARLCFPRNPRFEIEQCPVLPRVVSRRRSGNSTSTTTCSQSPLNRGSTSELVSVSHSVSAQACPSP